MKILALNLGSTSTKLGVFEDTTPVVAHTIRHTKEELAPYGGIMAQQAHRQGMMRDWLAEQGLPLENMDAIATRSGLIRPVPSGVFTVNEAAVADALSCRWGEHAANIGLAIAHEWSRQLGIPALFVDAPTTDELSDVARVSGFRGVERRSVFHALNARRVIHMHCQAQGQDPRQGRYIVAHLGGGISVSAWDSLRAVDVNNAVEGDGPFSPERAGSLSCVSVLNLLERAYAGNVTQLKSDLYRQGGLQSYMGSNDVRAMVARAGDEPEVRLILDAMYYGVAKAIGAMAAVLRGRVDGILLTGGLCYNEDTTRSIMAQVDWIAPCSVFPGEDELAALAEGAYRCLTGQEKAQALT